MPEENRNAKIMSQMTVSVPRFLLAGIEATSFRALDLF